MWTIILIITGVAAAMLLGDPPSASALIPVPSCQRLAAGRQRQGGRSRSRSRRHGRHGGGGMMTMYFDDVSRSSKYTIPWNLKELSKSNLGIPPEPAAGSSPNDPTADVRDVGGFDDRKKLAREKASALRQHLYGHDPTSASKLSATDVKRETEMWAESTGLVGSNPNRSPYCEISGLHVCESDSTLGCIAEFWGAVAGVISENTDSQGLWDDDQNKRSRLLMVLFPKCADMFDYETASTVNAALDFCKDSSRYFGNDFDISIYHPRFMNSPKLIQPMRHSPFPSLSVHVPGEEERSAKARAASVREEEERQAGGRRGSARMSKREDCEYIPQLNERRRSLERLFNSAAASPQQILRDDDDTASRDVVIEMMKAWMSDNWHQEKALTNRALQFAGTVHDRWIVTDEDVAEVVYRDIWNAISSLHDYGCEVTSSAQREINPIESSVVSAMFISPNFCAYNSTGFRKFAVTINAALKHLTGGKMFIELFHPEFVGPKGCRNEFRRSPSPAIQICYRL